MPGFPGGFVVGVCGFVPGSGFGPGVGVGVGFGPGAGVGVGFGPGAGVGLIGVGLITGGFILGILGINDLIICPVFGSTKALIMSS